MVYYEALFMSLCLVLTVHGLLLQKFRKLRSSLVIIHLSRNRVFSTSFDQDNLGQTDGQTIDDFEECAFLSNKIPLQNGMRGGKKSDSLLLGL